MAELKKLTRELRRVTRKLRKLEKGFRYLTYEQIENSDEGDLWIELDTYRHDIEREIYEIKMGA